MRRRGARPRARPISRSEDVATQAFAFHAGDRHHARRQSDPHVGPSERRAHHASSSRGRCRRATTGARASSPGSSTPRGRAAAQALRIANTDRLILDWTAACLRQLRVRSRVEEPTAADGLTCVRVRGGLRERLRFFHLTDPAITRKRTVQGMALKSDARTRVASDRAARRRDAPLRHHDRHRRLHRQRRGQPQLLRPPHPHLPRLQRRPRLREGDRGQGQRARGAAGRAGAAVVEGRARRHGDQHRPVPVGRGPLQAHARDLGGAARRGQPVLGADEVAAAAARPRPHAGDRRGHRHQREPLGAHASTRRRGGRASRTRRTRGRGWRRWPSSTAAGIPTGDPRRAADARDQRRPAQVEEILQAGGRGGGDRRQRHRAAPARRGARHLHGVAALLPARPRASATRSSMHAARTCRG